MYTLDWFKGRQKVGNKELIDLKTAGEREKLKVFIAENEVIILESFKLMVKRMGYLVAGYATGGKEALKQIREISPDLILMDINLPGIDGLTVLEKVNQDQIIPAIIVSGEFSDKLIDRANEIGVFGYLIKPIDEKQLEIAIKVALNRYAEFHHIMVQNGNLTSALKERKLVERAKGILMDQFGLKESDAMKSLQKKSRDSNKKISVVAEEIIEKASILGGR